MDLREKVSYLKALKTKKLVEEDIPKAFGELEAALHAENSFRDFNYSAIASGTNDCQEVKGLLADLVFKVPVGPNNKPMTVPQREAWLILQRKKDPIANAITNQQNVLFNLENMRISAEMAKKRLEGLKAVLSLKIAQIRFLSGD